MTGAGRPVYYAVDGWRNENEVMTFYCKGELVYACRREGTWAIVSRDVCNVVSDADYARHQLAEGKALETFMAELDPKGWEEAQAVMKSGDLEALMSGQGHSHAPSRPDDGKPVPGQYL